MRVDFNKFSESARSVLTCSQEEAQRLQYNQIDTDILMLGLLRQVHSAAAKILFNFGLDISKARLLIGKNPADFKPPFGLTESTDRVIKRAWADSINLKHNSVEPEHLLLALAEVYDGKGADLLKRLRITPEEIIQEVGKSL